MRINSAGSAYAEAYARWFSDYTAERRRRKKRQGVTLADFPPPPTNPADIAAAVEAVGVAPVLRILGIHRSTLARWLAGTSIMPRSAWLLLVLLAEGRLPGMSDDWRQFRFIGDRLHIIGTRYSYSALEIAGWHYQTAHAEALAAQVAELRRQNAELLRLGDFSAANDPIARAG